MNRNHGKQRHHGLQVQRENPCQCGSGLQMEHKNLRFTYLLAS